jgi:hypothetical protein
VSRTARAGDPDPENVSLPIEDGNLIAGHSNTLIKAKSNIHLLKDTKINKKTKSNYNDFKLLVLECYQYVSVPGTCQQNEVPVSYIFQKPKMAFHSGTGTIFLKLTAVSHGENDDLLQKNHLSSNKCLGYCVQ